MSLRLYRGPTTFTPPPEARVHALAGEPLASFRRRAAAILVDFVLAGLGFIAVSLPVSKWLEESGRLGHAPHISFNFFNNWYSLAWTVSYFGLTTWWGRGATPGKRLLGIRVHSLVHEHLSLWHCIERGLGYGASMLEGGFGFFQYYMNPNRQTVHDRIAETIVVREVRRPAGSAPSA